MHGSFLAFSRSILDMILKDGINSLGQFDVGSMYEGKGQSKILMRMWTYLVLCSSEQWKTLHGLLTKQDADWGKKSVLRQDTITLQPSHIHIAHSPQIQQSCPSRARRINDLFTSITPSSPACHPSSGPHRLLSLSPARPCLSATDSSSIACSTRGHPPVNCQPQD